jgi:hypothetical protein
MKPFKIFAIGVLSIAFLLISAPDVAGKSDKSKGNGSSDPAQSTDASKKGKGPNKGSDTSPEPGATDPGAVGDMVQIDTGGRPVAVTHNVLGTPAVAYFYGADLRYARPGSVSWDVQSLGSHGDYLHNGIDMALDGNGLPGIVYDATYASGLQVLEYAHFDGAAWNFESIDARGVHARIVYNAQGNPLVSYRKVLDKDHSVLCFAEKINGNWALTVLDESTRSYSLGDVMYTDIDVDDSGNVGISYGYRAGRNDQLRYAYRDSGGWHIEVVDAEFLGTYSSIKFGGSTPNIAYVASGTGGMVKLATGNGSGGWSNSLLPNMGEFPIDVDLDLNTAGSAVVAFRDSGNGMLILVEGNPGNFSARQVTSAYAKSMSFNPMQNTAGIALANGVGLVLMNE